MCICVYLCCQLEVHIHTFINMQTCLTTCKAFFIRLVAYNLQNAIFFLLILLMYVYGYLLFEKGRKMWHALNVKENLRV